jgi:hypothetical protein
MIYNQDNVADIPSVDLLTFLFGTIIHVHIIERSKLMTRCQSLNIALQKKTHHCTQKPMIRPK